MTRVCCENPNPLATHVTACGMARPTVDGLCVSLSIFVGRCIYPERFPNLCKGCARALLGILEDYV